MWMLPEEGRRLVNQDKLGREKLVFKQYKCSGFFSLQRQARRRWWSFISFHFYILGGLPFITTGFQGAFFLKEKIDTGLKYNLTKFTNKTEKVSQDIERKIKNGTMRAWLLASGKILERCELLYSH